MAEGSKWTPGKIFLLIAGILGGLALVCCGAGWLILGDKIMAGFDFREDATRFVLKLQSDFGAESGFDIEQNDRGEMVLAVAVKDELTPERVAEVQDSVWRTVSECFGKNGFLPVRHVAIGRPGTGTKRKHAAVLDWSAHSVTVEELEKRTGVAAPPLVKFMPDEFAAEGAGYEVHVKGGEEDGGDEGK